MQRQQQQHVERIVADLPTCVVCKQLRTNESISGCVACNVYHTAQFVLTCLSFSAILALSITNWFLADCEKNTLYGFCGRKYIYFVVIYVCATGGIPISLLMLLKNAIINERCGCFQENIATSWKFMLDTVVTFSAGIGTLASTQPIQIMYILLPVTGLRMCFHLLSSAAARSNHTFSIVVRNADAIISEDVIDHIHRSRQADQARRQRDYRVELTETETAAAPRHGEEDTIVPGCAPRDEQEESTQSTSFQSRSPTPSPESLLAVRSEEDVVVQ